MKTCPVCDTRYLDQHTNCPSDGAVLIESLELTPGHIVRSKYRIVRKLGQGGMGSVFLAEHQLLGGQVALKFLAIELSRNPDFVKRFRNEARAAYQLRHPNIVEVADLDQDGDGSLFIAMEYVAGPNLRSVLREAKGPLPVERALHIARGIVAGLAAAHARGAVHRDIKPENILLGAGPDGEEQAKILDFGIAAMTDGVTDLSRTQGLLLTPEYAAPEQWRGMPAAELDGRTDLYALGGVLYEMLAGRTPFLAVNPEGWMFQHLQGVPEQLGLLRPDLVRENPGLDALVMRLLAREREQRFPSAVAVLEALVPKPLVPLPAPMVQPGLAPGPDPVVKVPPAAHLAVVAEQPRAAVASFNPSPPYTRAMKWAAWAVLIVISVGILFTVWFSRSKPVTAVPVLSPSGGTFSETQSVAISDSTPNAVIHYTVDGSPPTKRSPVYNKPLTSLPNGAVVRAMAVAEGHIPSLDVTGVYTRSDTATEVGADQVMRHSEIKANGQTMVSLERKPMQDAGHNEEQRVERQPEGAPREELDRATWTDPSTKLMWTKMDNGSDLTWQQAAEFCRNLQFSGYTDWRLPTIDELQGIYESSIKVPGHCCNGLNVTWHVKGKLQLSGWQWSSSQGNASSSAWGFNFDGGVRYASPVAGLEDERALCVRRSGE